jgi:Spy/CpxP family protein refolding chaperone
MKNQVKNLLILAAIAGSMTVVSCRETKEDDSSIPMQHEMEDGEHMEDNNMMDDSMMDDSNMNEDHMGDDSEETTSDLNN